jgi:hypothetical protein
VLIAAITKSNLQPVGCAGVVLLFAGAALFVAGLATEITALYAGLLPAMFGILLIIVGRKTTQLSPAKTLAPPDQKLREWVRKWEAAGRPIPRLLRAPTLDRAPGPYREKDIYDYGVEKILIVQHDILVDLFVKNNLHAEQRALVLSERGYPGYLLPVAQRLLAERPDLPVVLLHDSTPEGVSMMARMLASSVLPLAGRKLVDAGITPRSVSSIKSLAPTLPGNHGNAVPVDYLPFGALAGGLAGMAAAGLLLPAAIAHAEALQQRPPYASAGGDAGGDIGSAGVDAVSDFGADFGDSDDFGGDADFG